MPRVRFFVPVTGYGVLLLSSIARRDVIYVGRCDTHSRSQRVHRHRRVNQSACDASQDQHLCDASPDQRFRPLINPSSRTCVGLHV